MLMSCFFFVAFNWIIQSWFVKFGEQQIKNCSAFHKYTTLMRIIIFDCNDDYDDDCIKRKNNHNLIVQYLVVLMLLQVYR